MSRYRAALYHLSISLIVFFFLTYLVLVHWFPGFFYAIDGGWEGMRIIIGVDLILGPTLTLMVFKVGKPGLKLDQPAMLMEAATTSALYCANNILSRERLKQEPIFSVPLWGVFA